MSGFDLADLFAVDRENATDMIFLFAFLGQQDELFIRTRLADETIS